MEDEFGLDFLDDPQPAGSGSPASGTEQTEEFDFLSASPQTTPVSSPAQEPQSVSPQTTPVSSPARESQPSPSSSSSFIPGVQMCDENSPLRQYEKQKQEEIKEQEKKEEARRKEEIERAQETIEKIYEERDRKIENRKGENRDKEEELKEKIARSLDGDNSWESIVSLIDLQAGKTEGKDVSRMRTLFLEAKHLPINSLA
eukprot:CAMPEP_0174258268 /NCGR_PEP_ID=MMETSP0439-20130205/7294_1 /TAXON_ID=0 /ORGANISM="Stereomyxa ramosa, Strain Chinc5" /LENGTH=200 /DNA_ID=CAMNT_0015341715 /DNA_START=24 /DNA_END=626 /DNA_ORIENTATION=-